MKFNNPQGNDMVEWVNQRILNMLVTKDLDGNFFECISPWGETLASIAWEKRYSYHFVLVFAHVHELYVIEVLFNLTSIVGWRVITTNKNR